MNTQPSSAAPPEVAAIAADVVLKTRGLVAFWDFSESGGGDRVDRTKNRFRLREVGGPIERTAGGTFSGHAAHFNGTQYLTMPHAEMGALNIGGRKAKVSMFALVRIEDLSRGTTIAGVWSEGKGRDDDTGARQYALLLNMPTYGGKRQVVPHISSEGGVTRRKDGTGLPWCADYAASRSEVAVGRWVTMGFTYDGDYIRAYYEGVMEPRALDPMADKREDSYFTQEGPNGKDRGMNPYFHGRGIFQYDAKRDAQAKPDGGSDFTVGARYAVGSMLREAFRGSIAGLAVFDRALMDGEMMQLHRAANVARMNTTGE